MTGQEVAQRKQPGTVLQVLQEVGLDVQSQLKGSGASVSSGDDTTTSLEERLAKLRTA